MQYNVRFYWQYGCHKSEGEQTESLFRTIVYRISCLDFSKARSIEGCISSCPRNTPWLKTFRAMSVAERTLLFHPGTLPVGIEARDPMIEARQSLIRPLLTDTEISPEFSNLLPHDIATFPSPAMTLVDVRWRLLTPSECY